jgi:tetratricopeptide (TPR) repeat protein
MQTYLRFFIKMLVLGVLIFSAAYVVLITPDNPVMRIFRGEISDIATGIIIGPYPVESDFKQLSENGIETIVSLLDPALPYEKQLLEQETVLAKQYRMRFLNFPMASILGQKMGAYYDNNARAAADAIVATKGKIYLHCYLGIHRVATVKNLLEKRQIKVGRYILREGERSKLDVQLDAAEKNYSEGNYQQAQQLLDAMKQPSPAAVLLYGWVDFRLGNIAMARKYFNVAATAMPQANEPLLGLAYCDLRENNLSAAEAHFTKIIEDDAANVEALNGMGLVRFRQGRLPEAADYLKRVLQLNPQHPEANATLRSIEGIH